MENHSNDRKHEHPVLFNQSGPAISFKAVNWSRLLGYLKPYRGRMTLAVLTLLISSGFGLAFPLVIVRMLDSVTKAKSFAPLNNLALLLGGLPAPGGLLVFTDLPPGLHREYIVYDQSIVELCVDKETIANISLKYRMNFLTPNCILRMENL